MSTQTAEALVGKGALGMPGIREAGFGEVLQQGSPKESWKTSWSLHLPSLPSPPGPEPEF